MRPAQPESRSMASMFPALLRKLYLDLQASYWFIPSAMTVLAALAAVGCEWLDSQGASYWLPPLVFAADSNAARNVLGVVAPASIGAAGVMFSMTMVAVSFASSNFGPRLIGNFMQDRGVQFSLGALLSTYVFSLTILRGIRDNPDSHVPALSVTVALALAAVSVGVLIYFVHHIPEMISLENVTARLGQRLLRRIAELPLVQTDAMETPEFAGHTENLRLPMTGYIQALDAGGLRKLAKRNGWKLHVEKGPGNFVAPHIVVARIGCVAALDDAQRDKLCGCFAVGAGRTESQNPGFLAQQLTEIIARALSPGTNDPISAINCLNWLHSALHSLIERGPLDPVEEHAAETLGTRVLSFQFILQMAHTDPRPYIAADPLVTGHAYRRLKELQAALSPGPRRTSVEREIIDLLSEARSLCPGSVETARIAAAEPLFTDPGHAAGAGSG